MMIMSQNIGIFAELPNSKYLLRDRQTQFVMVGLELLLGSWSIFSAEIAAFIRIPFRRCKWNVNDAFRKWETNMEASEDASDSML